MTGNGLVRYISPFGTPAWMRKDIATQRMVQDDALWLLHQAAGTLSEYQKEVGPPRYEERNTR